jgi:hypothetical protein
MLEIYLQDVLDLLVLLRVGIRLWFNFSQIRVRLLVPLGPCFRGLLLLFSLALKVVLSEIAVLAKTVGVMRLVGVLTCRCSPNFAFPVVTLEAHVLGILVLMVTNGRVHTFKLFPHLLRHLLLNLLLEDVRHLGVVLIPICQ